MLEVTEPDLDTIRLNRPGMLPFDLEYSDGSAEEAWQTIGQLLEDRRRRQEAS